MGDSAEDLEASRQRKIRENKEKLQALGVKDAARALGSVENAKQNKQPAKRKRAQSALAPREKRASERTKNVVINYNEDQNDHLLKGLPRRGGGGGNGSRSYYTGAKHLDDDDAYHARVEAGIVLNSQSLDGTPSKSGATNQPNSARKRGPQDSGKGVRVMGGKVYDSKYGVTCHWCRQKTLCESVTCTAPSCGVRRMPVSFCKSCLLNRHGEDWKQARESGRWVCPPCRGSCGPGCTICCNCGPCRKKAGLAPTGQVKSQAIADGFDNVHDWLVFRETGESAAALVLRKWEAPWAAWLNGSSDSDKEENVNASNVDAKKALPSARSRNNSTAGAAPANEKVLKDKQGGEYGDIEDEEPPRKVAKPQKKQLERKADSSQGVSRSVSGILPASPSQGDAPNQKKTCKVRLDFDSGDDEGDCLLLPVGAAPVTSNAEVVKNLSCVEAIKQAPKRTSRAKRQAKAT